MEDRKKLANLLTNERLAVLSTHFGGQPYASLVAFAVSNDFKTLVFVTPKSTRKYENILQDSRVAMLLDNRQSAESNIAEGIAVTAIGSAKQLTKQGDLFAKFIEKNGELQNFAQSQGSVFLGVDVGRYILVDHFQHVIELEP